MFPYPHIHALPLEYRLSCSTSVCLSSYALAPHPDAFSLALHLSHHWIPHHHSSPLHPSITSNVTVPPCTSVSTLARPTRMSAHPHVCLHTRLPTYPPTAPPIHAPVSCLIVGSPHPSSPQDFRNEAFLDCQPAGPPPPPSLQWQHAPDSEAQVGLSHTSQSPGRTEAPTMCQGPAPDPPPEYRAARRRRVLLRHPRSAQAAAPHHTADPLLMTEQLTPGPDFSVVSHCCWAREPAVALVKRSVLYDVPHSWYSCHNLCQVCV